MRESSRKLQGLRQESEEKHTLGLRERDNLISQLQTALHTHSQETQVHKHIHSQETPEHTALRTASVISQLRTALHTHSQELSDEVVCVCPWVSWLCVCVCVCA